MRIQQTIPTGAVVAAVVVIVSVVPFGLILLLKHVNTLFTPSVSSFAYHCILLYNNTFGRMWFAFDLLYNAKKRQIYKFWIWISFSRLRKTNCIFVGFCLTEFAAARYLKHLPIFFFEDTWLSNVTEISTRNAPKKEFKKKLRCLGKNLKKTTEKRFYIVRNDPNEVSIKRHFNRLPKLSSIKRKSIIYNDIQIAIGNRRTNWPSKCLLKRE